MKPINMFSQQSEAQCENASQAVETVNGVYGADTVTANYVQFWFRRIRSGIFDVKDAPRTGKPDVENVDNVIEVTKVNRPASNFNIAQELKSDHKIILSHLCSWIQKEA
ncbi:histone-lysine N-methyltransferase SETMAR [Trichonephila clavipes]|uniref:Histone-lysine N-methyltransferase SETMAR n=1 Tax=Trichonephila clavipes TaxID=2585209 RepID=A0A8X6SMU2_TRICX|nr:histone-lysine N-methyltransferase SETMAR [Trichonephila clavipes]